MEQEPKKGFSYWFHNVFWYHYGKLSIALLAALVVAVWLTVDALQKDEYDLNVAITLNGPIAESDTGRLNTLLAAAVGDVNGDGKTLVNIQTVNLGDAEHLEDNQYRMLLYLSLPEYTLFLMDEQYSATYCAKEDDFQALENYGVQTDDPNGKRIYVGDRAVLRELGDYGYYACLSDWTVDGKGSADMTAAAVRALNAILDSEEYEGAV